MSAISPRYGSDRRTTVPTMTSGVPKVLYEVIGDPDREKSQRVMAAMLKMKKIEIAELERAAAAA
jgi:hypothetical protein